MLDKYFEYKKKQNKFQNRIDCWCHNVFDNGLHNVSEPIYFKW